MIKFNPDMLDQVALIKSLYERYCYLKYHCPHCYREAYPKRLFFDKTVRCPHCNKKFSWRTRTVFEDSKLKPKLIYSIIILASLGLDEKYVSSILKVSLQTVQIILQKIKRENEVNL